MNMIPVERTLDYGRGKNLNILMLNEDSFAEVIDFSDRGVTCMVYTKDAIKNFESKGVDLFNCLAGQYLRDIPCKVAYSSRPSSNQKGNVEKRIYQLEFADLSDARKRELDQFISDGYEHFVLHENNSESIN